MTTTPRSLEVRVTEYRDNLVSIASQMDELAARVAGHVINGKPADTAPLQEGAKLYRTIAEDITKIIAGEDLKEFIVEGTIG